MFPLMILSNSRSVHRFVYQVVIPKTLAPKELVKVFESDERIVLPPWDPMVSSEVHTACHLA
jgi:aminopeptidase C